MARENEHNPNLDSTSKSEADQGRKIQDISLWSDRKYILTLSVVLLISFIVYLPSLENGVSDQRPDIDVRASLPHAAGKMGVV